MTKSHQAILAKISIRIKIITCAKTCFYYTGFLLKTVISSYHIYELNMLVQKHKRFNVWFFMYSVESEMFDRIKHNKYINLTTKRLAVKQKFVNCKPTL